jgi:hypothetical protein
MIYLIHHHCQIMVAFRHSIMYLYLYLYFIVVFLIDTMYYNHIFSIGFVIQIPYFKRCV